MTLRRCKAFFLPTLVILLSVSAAQAQSLGDVIRLRADEVTLTAVDKGQKPAERIVSRTAVTADHPWPIRKNNGDGTLVVDVDGKQYRIAEMDVVTNAARTAQACATTKAPKVGGTRGVQEPPPCK